MAPTPADPDDADGDWRPAGGDAADLAAALAQIQQLRATLDRLEGQFIVVARSRGTPWRVIAAYLGVQSPQAAAQRLHRLQARER